MTKQEIIETVVGFAVSATLIVVGMELVALTVGA